MSHKKSRQSGSVLVVVIFVIVVMGFLASSLTRVNWSNSDNQTREHLGTQAWLLAHSANEWALTQLYPIPEIATSSAFQAMCTTTVSGSSPSLSVDMPCSSPKLTCNNEGELDGQVFYRVEATAICGSGKLQVQRSQEVWVKE
ncbi:MSHA biogenesis protein MshP [Vibrio cortegadensis]|uniref:MSHA biogenesis protein MshP n=1 Tax=Vibrio cortegadensis TaxID=1328770 RepID=UPI0021C442AE|nr:MSHA biogenesis protein MshP [Vibrio cortegadensis]MDN3699403.1 MSHA biogenesis protein MshP [Vibrio cortegadensis]